MIQLTCGVLTKEGGSPHNGAFSVAPAPGAMVTSASLIDGLTGMFVL